MEIRTAPHVYNYSIHLRDVYSVQLYTRMSNCEYVCDTVYTATQMHIIILTTAVYTYWR